MKRQKDEKKKENVEVKMKGKATIGVKLKRKISIFYLSLIR